MMKPIVEDFDSITLDLENDSSFLSQNDQYFYLHNKSQIYEVNENGVVNTYSLPEICYCVRRIGSDIYFVSRNRIYKFQNDGTFGEKKLKHRILSVLPLDTEYPLLALICKELKLLQLQIKDTVLNLEKYGTRCDASVLYLDLISENLVLCVYKTESVVKYCMVGVDGTEMVLLRKDILSDDPDLKFDVSILYNHFLVVFRDSFTVLSLDRFHYLLDSSDKHKIDFQPYELLKLVNDYILCVVRLNGEEMVMEFRDLYSDEVFTHFSLNLGFIPKRIVSVVYSKGIYKVLVELDDSRFSVVSFSHELPTETISYYDPYETFPTPNELEKLIDSSEVIITPKLIDHIIENGLVECSRKILRCIHIPELEAVRLVKNDLSLLEDFLMYTKGSEEEFKKAFKSEIDGNTFKLFLDKMFEVASRDHGLDRDYLMRAISMINVLLDAKAMELMEFDQETVHKLQSLVEGCQKEHLDLQSLLSFTNTLLDNKFKYNSNPLITSIDISLE